MKYDRCGGELLTEDSYRYLGKTLCEDCYIDTRYPSKGCDLWALYSATRSRQALVLKEIETLTELKTAIYRSIKEAGKTTRAQLIKNLGLTSSELQTQLAILRHCKLAKNMKEDGQIYLVPFSKKEVGIQR